MNTLTDHNADLAVALVESYQVVNRHQAAEIDRLVRELADARAQIAALAPPF